VADRRSGRPMDVPLDPPSADLLRALREVEVDDFRPQPYHGFPEGIHGSDG
jgi:hypothetical protein